MSVDEAWKERRAELLQSLTVNRKSADKMVEFIKDKNPNTTIWNAKDLANRFTCHIMEKILWGIEENIFESLNTHSTNNQMAIIMMLQQSLRCVRYYGQTAAWPWLRKIKPERFFPLISDSFFKQLAIDVIKQKNFTRNNKQNDVINHLLQLKEKKSLNDVQIVGHTTTVLIDGFEMAAIIIAHCLLMLSRHLTVQQKLRLELAKAGDNIAYDELMDLPYLDQCIQETLRLFPPLATLFKLCTKTVELVNELNGKKVLFQPQDVVYISAYSLHYDPEYYENPEDFWPERFNEELGEVKKYRDMGVFLPFGDGPRVCPGMKLGLSEDKLAVAELIKNCKISLTLNASFNNKIASNSFLLTVEGDIGIKF